MTTRSQVGAVFALSAAALVAQLTRGFISGTVQDATGAAMVNVRIAITNKATNQERETTTNALGVYRFVGVEPGVYAVEFTSQGFETRKVDNVTVGTTQEVVLNQVLPLMEDPVAVIDGALRVGKRVAVSYPNFAHWRIRATLALGGRLPVNPALPYQWYDTPNIRLVTVSDFRRLCRERGWKVTREAFVAQRGPESAAPLKAFPNLRASLALAVLEK